MLSVFSNKHQKMETYCQNTIACKPLMTQEQAKKLNHSGNQTKITKAMRFSQLVTKNR
jgi:hypothetical protein